MTSLSSGSGDADDAVRSAARAMAREDLQKARCALALAVGDLQAAGHDVEADRVHDAWLQTQRVYLDLDFGGQDV